MAPPVDRPLTAVGAEYDRPIVRKFGDDRDRPCQCLPVIAVQVGEEFDHGPPADARRRHRLDPCVALGQPDLIAANELPQLPVAADLAGFGVVDHHLTWPHGLQGVRVALGQRGEVLPDRIGLTRGASLHACQLRGVDEVRKPRHRDSLAVRRPRLLPPGTILIPGADLMEAYAAGKLPAYSVISSGSPTLISPGESGMRFCPKTRLWPERRRAPRIFSGCVPRTPVA